MNIGLPKNDGYPHILRCTINLEIWRGPIIRMEERNWLVSDVVQKAIGIDPHPLVKVLLRPRNGDQRMSL